MNAVQKKLYQIMIKFDKICKKNNIIYYLGGGTALGALRHKGFLPWDDDVDLYISRQNYEKILSIQNEFLEEDLVLVNQKNYPKYRNTLVRCVDKYTTAITKARIADGSPRGQFVELFIMDPIPREKEKQDEWFTKHWIYTELMDIAFCVANYRIYNYINEELYYEYKQKCDKNGYNNVLQELENELFLIDETDADEFCSRWGLRNLVYKIKWFEKPRYVDFEDTKFPVAKCAEEVARFDYGDNWVYIPNVEDQIKHNFVEDMNIPYNYYVEEYTNFFNEDVIHSKYENIKEKKLDLFFESMEIFKKKIELKNQQIKISLEYNSNFDIEKELKAKKYGKVFNLFSTWFYNQNNLHVMQSETYYHIDDKLLYFALVSILKNGNYSFVRKVLSFRKKYCNLTNELQILFDFVDAIRNIYIAIDYGNHKLAQENLKKVHKLNYEYSYDQFNLKILDLKYSISNKTEKFDYLLEQLQIFLKEYANNGEIMYLIAELYYGENEIEKAIEWYQKAYKNTKHGFVIMSINERLSFLKEKVKVND